MIKLSYSKIQTYKECPAKYKFQYVDRLSLNVTSSALLFGSAFDSAINYVLLKHKKKQAPNPKFAKRMFHKVMAQWNGQNELVYFKADLPEHLKTADPAANQLAAHAHLCSLGELFIDEYIKSILPQFAEVIEVQKREIITNASGDTLNFVLDCIVKLQDGRIVLLDTKTASKPYPRNSVKKSEQLATYNEYYPTEWCGYVVFNKHLKDGKPSWQIIVDKIDEGLKEQVFVEMDDVLCQIKQNVFDKNPASCFSYGRRCEYYKLCHFGNGQGLIKR